MLNFTRVVALILVGASSSPAAAQTGPPPQRSIPQAPIGHRQPSAADVPADDSVAGTQATGPQAPQGGVSPAQKADDERARKAMGSVCSRC